jgi:hypothetical protein
MEITITIPDSLAPVIEAHLRTLMRVIPDERGAPVHVPIFADAAAYIAETVGAHIGALARQYPTAEIQQRMDAVRAAEAQLADATRPVVVRGGRPQ